ncbi:MAG: D-alanine--D-alanine ligase, partial [Dehalococcoidia bacterium]
NVEFFWDQESDRLWLLEINTRITQSHGDLYEKVDGVSNHQVMVDIALGRRPEFPYRRGGFKRAAKFFLRTTENAFVRYAPSGDELRRVSEAIPGAFVLPQVGSGMWLSDIVEQDSYSYALAHIYLGGRNQKELLERYDQVVSMLDFQLTDREEERDSMPMAS